MKHLLCVVLALFAGSAVAATLGIQTGSVQTGAVSQVQGTTFAGSASAGAGIAGNVAGARVTNSSEAAGVVKNGGVAVGTTSTGSQAGFSFGGSLGSALQASGSLQNQTGTGAAVGSTNVLGIFLVP